MYNKVHDCQTRASVCDRLLASGSSVLARMGSSVSVKISLVPLPFIPYTLPFARKTYLICRPSASSNGFRNLLWNLHTRASVAACHPAVDFVCAKTLQSIIKTKKYIYCPQHQSMMAAFLNTESPGDEPLHRRVVSDWYLSRSSWAASF